MDTIPKRRTRVRLTNVAEPVSGTVQGKPDGQKMDDLIADGVTVLVELDDPPMTVRADVRNLEPLP